MMVHGEWLRVKGSFSRDAFLRPVGSKRPEGER